MADRSSILRLPNIWASTRLTGIDTTAYVIAAKSDFIRQPDNSSAMDTDDTLISMRLTNDSEIGVHVAFGPDGTVAGDFTAVATMAPFVLDPGETREWNIYELYGLNYGVVGIIQQSASLPITLPNSTVWAEAGFFKRGN